MKKLPLKRSPEYKARVRAYARELADRYRFEIAEVFLDSVRTAEHRIHDNNDLGTNAPYLLAGQKVILKELYFDSGPASYCLIYDVTSECVELISLWHGCGSRDAGHMTRIWVRGRKLEQKV